MTKSKRLENMQLTDDGGVVWELKYYVQIFDDEVGNTFYGIKIEKIGVENSTSEETCGLTRSYEEVKYWIRKLAAGTVTPSSLHDIVDDLVG